MAPRSDKSENFERRLKETMDSELEPEMVTPNTAGCEETEGREVFPLVNTFNQANMLTRPHHGHHRNTSGRGEDQD